MRRARVLGLIGLLPMWAAAATTSVPATRVPAPATTVTELAAVAVTGSQPGPGLWKVTRAGHVMWILGVDSPLPTHMQWQTDEVEQAIAGSQVVLQSPTIKLDTDVGFFGKLLLLPALMGARKNPDGITLQQRVSADDYARWLVLKARYIGRDRGIERWRPIFAALQLYRKALKRHGLGFAGGVERVVEKLAKRHRVPLTPVNWHVVVKDPRAAIRKFSRDGLGDTSCFHRTMMTLEAQLPVITARANAWASGDIQTLRRLPLQSQRDACIDAINETALARQIGMNQIAAGIEGVWLSAVDRSMRAHAQTFALLPMRELLKPDGPLADLRLLGYAVQSPQDLDALTDPSP